MATPKQQLQADLPWDINRLSHDPGEHASDAALDILSNVDKQSDSVDAVRAYASAGKDSGRVATKHLLQTLKLADGRLSLVTWSSAGITAIGFRPAEECFDVGQFSGIAKQMGKSDFETYERATRRRVKDLLSGSHPTIIARSDSGLLPQLDQEVTA